MHNGWTNRETWAKEVELANNQALYTQAMEIVRGAIASSAPGTKAREEAIEALAATLRSNFRRSAAERTAVNWQELAETWVANIGV